MAMLDDDDFPFPEPPTNVVPIRDDGPPSWMDDIPPHGDPMSSVSREPLVLQYFDEIEMQLTGLWLIKRLLPAVGMAVLYGHPGSGKTFLALDWALHVALGWDWHGHKVKQGIVVYVAAEGLSGLRNRVEAFRRHHNVKGVPFALIPSPIDLQQPNADVNRLIAAIKEAAAHFDLPVAMIVIDTLSKTFGAGKENTDDMVPYVANCGRVALEFECLTMPVHHRPKDAESEEPRGHSSLKGGAETVIIVEAGETKKARITKQKDGEDGIEVLFRLKVIELGLDEDEEPVTSCVVEPTDVDLTPRGDTPEHKAMRLPDGAKLALNNLDDTLVASGFYPPSDIPDTILNRIKVGKVVKLEDWRTRCTDTAGHGPDMKPDTLTRAFRRNLEKLQVSNIIQIYGQYVWRTWESRTRADIKSDTDKARTGQTGHSGPPLQGTQEMSGSMSGTVPPADDFDFGEPPPWMDEAPPPDLAWMDNPILNEDLK